MRLDSAVDFRTQYERDGYVFPVEVLTPREAESTLNRVDELRALGAPDARMPSTHCYFPWAFELASHTRLLDRVEVLLGPDVIVWGTLILSKAPGSEAIVPWHQDSAYSQFLNGAPALTAWIALTPATRENGCMRAVPGSHHQQLPFTTHQDPGDMLIRGLRIVTEIDEGAAVSFELRPGDASFHDVSLVHGSEANRSSGPRTGFIVRYTTAAIRQPEYPLHCVRGDSRGLICSAPPRDEGQEGLDAFIRSCLDERLKAGKAGKRF